MNKAYLKYFSNLLLISLLNFGCSVSYELQYPDAVPAAGIAYNLIYDNIDIKLKDSNNSKNETFYIDNLKDVKPYIELKPNSSLELSATIIKKDGSKSDNSSWATFDSTIATVDTNGKIYGVKEGIVTLKVFSKEKIDFFKLIELNITTDIITKPTINVSSLDIGEDQYSLKVLLKPNADKKDNYYLLSIESQTDTNEGYSVSDKDFSAKVSEIVYGNEWTIKKPIDFNFRKHKISAQFCHENINNKRRTCSESKFIEAEINPPAASFLLPTERAVIDIVKENNTDFPYSLNLGWNKVKRATFYKIFRNGVLIDTTEGTGYSRYGKTLSELQVDSLKYSVVACNEDSLPSKNAKVTPTLEEFLKNPDLYKEQKRIPVEKVCSSPKIAGPTSRNNLLQ